MTSIALTPSPTGISAREAGVSGFATRLLNAFAQLYRSYHNRCVVTALAPASDHLLTDLGLTRADLCDGLAEPFWRDPTHLLRERAHRRRGA